MSEKITFWNYYFFGSKLEKNKIWCKKIV